MTLTVEFTAPNFSILPWAQTWWEKDEKTIAFGWGPLQVYFTNFSPIAVGNYWRTVCKELVGQDPVTINKLDHLVQGYTNRKTVETKVREVMKERC